MNPTPSLSQREHAGTPTAPVRRPAESSHRGGWRTRGLTLLIAGALLAPLALGARPAFADPARPPAPPPPPSPSRPPVGPRPRQVGLSAVSFCRSAAPPRPAACRR